MNQSQVVSCLENVHHVTTPSSKLITRISFCLPRMLTLVFLIQLITAQRSFNQPVANKFRFPNENSRDQSLPLLDFNRTSSFFLPIETTGPKNLLVYDSQAKKFFTFMYQSNVFVDFGDMNPLGGDITTDVCKASSIGNNFSIVCRINQDTAPFDLHVFRFEGRDSILIKWNK